MAEGKDDFGDGPLAYVSLSGQIVECNREFANLFGVQSNELRGVDLTSLAKFDNPALVLEAAYKLDQLGSDVDEADRWRAVLKSSHVDDEYWLIAKRSNQRINGRSMLEVTASINVSSPSGKQKRESIRRSTMITEAKLEEITSTSFGVQRVLVVEDSPTALKLMARMVTRLGHEVMTAINGVDALELLRKETFDIVLMDINMPMMNGLEASHEFRKLERQNRASGKPYQKIIAMSGDISNTLFHEVTNAGFDAFIPKPLTEERFYEVLRMPVNTHK